LGNPGQLRAPWRILLFLGVAAASALILGALVPILVRAAGGAGVVGPFPITLPASMLIAHGVMLRWIDPRGWDFVGLDRAAFRPSRVAFGLGLGAIAIAAPTGALLLARQFEIQPSIPGSWLAATAQTTVYLIPAALWEELLFRGYLFAVVREAIGWKWALIATAFLFGLVHVRNSGADPEAITIIVIAGLFLGAILLATRSLYATWAAHFAWNWVMACGFHVSVSGNPFGRPDYQLVPTGPSWLTGGPWGPEGGVGAAVGLFIGVFYVYGRYLKSPEQQSR
jgi:hypothetical protein